MERRSPVLIAYDGSGNARHALTQAGYFFGGGRPAIVLYVWEPVELTAARRGTSDLSATATEETATSVAAEGVQLARAAGLDAEPRGLSLATVGTANTHLSVLTKYPRGV